MPARYRVRLRGRTFTIWDIDETHAADTAQEWLDVSDKAGIQADARATVERIGDEPDPADLLGSVEGVPPTHPALIAAYPRFRPPLWERVVERLVSFTRRWARPRTPPDSGVD